ncbi:hypothetical protein ACIBTV_26665 [Micromonospora sp. NPDC049366]|uniref:hypothetical protein n=1 Tax=Micromonospora sp. NPDC049366 TaxID=3364271 RepID=UPI00378A5012
MTRNLIAAGAALALLGGCALPAESSPAEPAGPVQPGDARQTGDFSVTTVQVGDRSITCIVWDGYDRNGGVSCDWSLPR